MKWRGPDLPVIFKLSGVALAGVLVVLLSACTGKPDNPVAKVLPPGSTHTPVPPTLAAPTPIPSSTPAPTPIPTLTPTPAPSLRRLTEPGCCSQPIWSLDGRQVIFLDKPAPEAPSGFYAVDVTQPGSAPVLLTGRVVVHSPDFQAVAYPQGNDLVVIERLDTGQWWEVDTDGHPPALSPDKSRLIWQNTSGSGPYNARRTDVWLAELSDDPHPQAELALTLYGGGVVAWFPDNRRWLVVARPTLEVEERVLSVFSLDDGSSVELARIERMSRITLSPGGTWVAFFVSFSEDPGEDGIWLVRTDGELRYKLNLFGSYQWRDDERLLVIPMEPGVTSQVVWQVDAPSGTAVRLTDPAVTPFKVASGDWSASPDGTGMAFVSAEDKALWLLTFNVP